MKIRIIKPCVIPSACWGQNFNVEFESETGKGEKVYLIRFAGNLIGINAEYCEVAEG